MLADQVHTVRHRVHRPGKVPEATFQRMDMRDLAFPPASFNAITSVYTVFHLPRVDHAALFAGFARVLTPGGRLLLMLATREYTGQEEFDGEMEFIGRCLPYSHDYLEVALSKLATAGLAVVSARLIETGGETFYWIVARKSVARNGVALTTMLGPP